MINRRAPPGDSHRERIRGKLVKKTPMLRRLGCHPFGLDRPTARPVIRTMCDEISISWQLQHEEPPIGVLLNIIYRKCLGVEYSTCTSVVRYEPGV